MGMAVGLLVDRPEFKCSAELIALAPEMAAEILRFAAWANKQPGLDPQEEEMELLAEKLRMIGDK